MEESSNSTPEYNRQRVESRLFLIEKYHSEMKELRKQGLVVKRQALVRFAERNNLHPCTLEEWLRRYAAEGKQGLTPSYGNRKGSSPYEGIISPMIGTVITTEDTINSAHQKVIHTCSGKSVRPPSQATVRRIIKRSGLKLHHECHRKAHTTLPVETTVGRTALEKLARDAARLALLKDFERRIKKVRNNSDDVKKQILLNFVSEKNLKISTFRHWWRQYIVGTNKPTISFGSKGTSRYEKFVLSLLPTLAAAGDTTTSIHRKIAAVCAQRRLPIPCWGTVQKIIKQHDFNCRRNYPPKTSISLRIEVDLEDPLCSALKALHQGLENIPAFSLPVRQSSMGTIRHLLTILGRRSPLMLYRKLTPDEVKRLRKYKAGLHKNHCKKASVLLLIDAGNCTLADAVAASGRHAGTILTWIKLFKEKGLDFIEVKVRFPERSDRLALRQNRIIDILHHPPLELGVNRTSWSYQSIVAVYEQLHGGKISTATVGRVVKACGYTWRRARTVLTSGDPQYKTKVQKVLETLRGLGPDDAFFFVDEAGPYRVKKYAGTSLMPKGETKKVPYRQRPKGKVQLIAALDAVENQVWWQFLEDKKATSVVGLLNELLDRYSGRRRLYLTWDAVAFHAAAEIKDWVKSTIESSVGGKPTVEIVPLPSHAQFLNVIEAVFSGMKKVVIKNSDYQSKEEMEAAISQYFTDRNEFYKENPKRAGNKIWDEQAFDLNKLVGGLFRRM